MSFLNELEVGTLKVSTLTRVAPPGAASTAPAPKNKVILEGPTLSNAVADAVVQKMISIPVGMVVTRVLHQVVVASLHGGTHTGKMGDLTADDGWIAGTTVALKAAANTVLVAGGAYATGAFASEYGKAFPTGGVINVTHAVGTGPDASVGTHRVLVEGYL